VKSITRGITGPTRGQMLVVSEPTDVKSNDRNGGEPSKNIPEFEGTVHKSAEFFGDTSGDTSPPYSMP
jgi:hypothetical protein